MKIADSNHSSRNSRLEIQRLQDRISSLHTGQDILNNRLQQIISTDAYYYDFENWLATTNIYDGKDKLTYTINKWAESVALAFFKEEKEKLLSEWESDYGSDIEPSFFMRWFLPSREEFLSIMQNWREETGQQINLISSDTLENFINDIKHELRLAENTLSELRLRLALQQSEYEVAEQNLSSTVVELEQMEKEHKTQLPLVVLNFWRALWNPGYYESREDLSAQLETAVLQREQQATELQKLYRKTELSDSIPFLEKRFLELKLEILSNLKNHQSPLLENLFNGILLEHYLSSCFLCSAEDNMDFKAEQVVGTQAVDDFKSLRQDMLSSASYEGGIDFLKNSYEKSLRDYHNNTPLLYNRSAVSLFHPFLENRVQCYSGTLLFFVMSELANATQSPRFAIFTSGHVLPGFLRYHRNTLDRMKSPHSPLGFLGDFGTSVEPQENTATLNQGQSTLYGIETTVAGQGLIHFGPPETVSGNLKIAPMYPFLLIEFLKSQISNFPDLYTKLKQDLETQGFLTENINPDSEEATSADSLLNATPFGFGLSDVPSGDRQRQTITQETGQNLYNLTQEEGRDQTNRDNPTPQPAQSDKRGGGPSFFNLTKPDPLVYAISAETKPSILGFCDINPQQKDPKGPILFLVSEPGQSSGLLCELNVSHTSEISDNWSKNNPDFCKNKMFEYMQELDPKGWFCHIQSGDKTCTFRDHQRQTCNIEENNDSSFNQLMAFLFASANGHIETAQLLLEQGVDINSVDNNGWTALHFAAIFGQYDSLIFLLEQGADVNSADNNGWTALHFAAIVGHYDSLISLLKQGADVNSENNEGITVLDIIEGITVLELIVKSMENIQADVNLAGLTEIHYSDAVAKTIAKVVENQEMNQEETRDFLISIIQDDDLVKILLEKDDKGDILGQLLHKATNETHLIQQLQGDIKDGKNILDLSQASEDIWNWLNTYVDERCNNDLVCFDRGAISAYCKVLMGLKDKDLEDFLADGDLFEDNYRDEVEDDNYTYSESVRGRPITTGDSGKTSRGVRATRIRPIVIEDNSTPTGFIQYPGIAEEQEPTIEDGLIAEQEPTIEDGLITEDPTYNSNGGFRDWCEDEVLFSPSVSN